MQLDVNIHIEVVDWSLNYEINVCFFFHPYIGMCTNVIKRNLRYGCVESKSIAAGFIFSVLFSPFDDKNVIDFGISYDVYEEIYI